MWRVPCRAWRAAGAAGGRSAATGMLEDHLSGWQSGGAALAGALAGSAAEHGGWRWRCSGARRASHRGSDAAGAATACSAAPRLLKNKSGISQSPAATVDAEGEDMFSNCRRVVVGSRRRTAPVKGRPRARRRAARSRREADQRERERASKPWDAIENSQKQGPKRTQTHNRTAHIRKRNGTESVSVQSKTNGRLARARARRGANPPSTATQESKKGANPQSAQGKGTAVPLWGGW